MSPREAELVAIERKWWKEGDWSPAIGSILSRYLFLSLLSMRDAARPRHVLVRILAGIAFYPLYLCAMVVWITVSLLLLLLSPVLFLAARVGGKRAA